MHFSRSLEAHLLFTELSLLERCHICKVKCSDPLLKWKRHLRQDTFSKNKLQDFVFLFFSVHFFVKVHLFYFPFKHKAFNRQTS